MGSGACGCGDPHDESVRERERERDACTVMTPYQLSPGSARRGGIRAEARKCWYRVGLSTVKAKFEERLTLAHFVVVRRVTGHSCSAGDAACTVPGLVVGLHRVRPQ